MMNKKKMGEGERRGEEMLSQLHVCEFFSVKRLYIKIKIGNHDDPAHLINLLQLYKTD